MISGNFIAEESKTNKNQIVKNSTEVSNIDELPVKGMDFEQLLKQELAKQANGNTEEINTMPTKKPFLRRGTTSGVMAAQRKRASSKEDIRFKDSDENDSNAMNKTISNDYDFFDPKFTMNNKNQINSPNKRYNSAKPNIQKN